uniref:Uncharacterized protein n=1 Tax=Rhizophora mucronata TaxID=61149 RepID=A0A2P2NFB7_RHIMU
MITKSVTLTFKLLRQVHCFGKSHAPATC